MPKTSSFLPHLLWSQQLLPQGPTSDSVNHGSISLNSLGVSLGLKLPALLNHLYYQAC